MGPARAARWSGAFAFERSVHAFVAAVLIGGCRLDEVGENAEADPPDGKRGEVPERLRCKRDTIV